MLEWSPLFETKLEIIDTQHQKLFEMVNALDDEITAEQENEDLLNQALDELLAYAQQHFSDEELMMGRYKLDEKYLALQRMEHKSFIYDINKMRECLSPDESLAERFDKLRCFVTAWLIYHTLRIDLLIPKQILAIKSGKSAAEAYEFAKLTCANPDVTKKVLNAVLHLWEAATVRIQELEAEVEMLNRQLEKH